MRLTSPARNLVLLCGALTAVVALAAREHWDSIDGFAESAMNWAAPAAGNGHANASGDPAIPPKYSLEAFQHVEGTFGQVAAGDMTGDGRPDVVTVWQEEEYAPPQVLIFPQLPAGGLAAPIHYHFPGDKANYSERSIINILLADVNGDGRKDAIFSTVAGLSMLQSEPGGTFAWRVDRWTSQLPTGSRAIAGDVDNDGNVDLVYHVRAFVQNGPVFQRWVVYYGDGTGNFPRHYTQSVPEGTIADMAFGDINSDGRADVSFISPLGGNPSGYSGIDLLASDGAAAFLPYASQFKDQGKFEGYQALAIGDFNHDGRNDLAVANTQTQRNRILFFYQDATGKLSSAPTRKYYGFYSPATVRDLLPVDLNVDGKADLVYTLEELGTLYYMLQGDDRMSEAVPVQLPVVRSPRSHSTLATGDFTGDGIPDIVVSGHYDGLAVLRGKLTPYTGPGGLPGAPGAATATLAGYDQQQAADTRALVTFTPPVSDGGTPVEGYEVHSIPEGGWDHDAGSTSLTHTVTMLENDTEYSFYVTARNAAGNGPASALSNPVLVRDVPLAQIRDGGTGREGPGGSVLIKVELGYPALKGGATVAYSIAPGTATANADYSPAPGTLQFAEGQQVAYIAVPIVDDAVAEPFETIFVTLSNPVNCVINPTYATQSASIYDNDTSGSMGAAAAPGAATAAATDPVQLWLYYGVVDEGNSGNVPMQFTLALSRVADHDISFDFSTGAGTATPGIDFIPVSSRHLVIPAGQPSITTDVQVIGDLAVETDEQFPIVISNMVGAPQPFNPWFDPIGGIIVNDDLPGLALAGTTVTEGDVGRKQAYLTVTASQPMAQTVYFEAVTLDNGGTATPGVDYSARLATPLQLAAGQQSLRIPIDILADTRLEPSETFQVALQGIQGAGLSQAPPPATVTIVDDDDTNGIAVLDARVVEGDGDQALVFTVQLSAPAPTPVTFDFFTDTGTATPGSDYQPVSLEGLSIPPGQTSMTIRVPVLGDDIPEIDETVTGNLNNVTGALPTRHQATGLIVDFDEPTVNIDDVVVVEGTGTNKTVYFHVWLSHAMPNVVRFEVASDMMGPTYYNDYRASYKGFDIDAGRTDAWYPVTIIADSMAEGTEYFRIVVSNSQYAKGGKRVALGTILDDDGPAATATMSKGRTAAARIETTKSAQRLSR